MKKGKKSRKRTLIIDNSPADAGMKKVEAAIIAHRQRRQARAAKGVG